MTQMAIDEWVNGLSKIHREDFTLPEIEKYLQQNQVRVDTLQPYLFYAKSHYTRNLVHKCDLFEVIAICWEVGQSSRIHNHRGQNCWMAVPIGKLRVQNFRVDNKDRSHGTCRICPSGSYDMDYDHPGTVQREEPVHQVLNLSEFNQRATSIHVYSHPYSSCEIYSIDKGTYSDAPLHYTSEYGKLSPDEKLF
jgi:cysteine dioxygenase